MLIVNEEVGEYFLFEYLLGCNVFWFGNIFKFVCLFGYIDGGDLDLVFFLVWYWEEFYILWFKIRVYVEWEILGI